MHTADTAYETLELLWKNYLILARQVDLYTMPQEVLAAHAERGSMVRPLRIAAWLARYGYFISAWTLWEGYSRNLCESLPPPKEPPKRPNESTVDWVARTLAANSKVFHDYKWFASANCMRNLIAHYGGRVDNPKAEKLLERSRIAFPAIDTWQDGYLSLEDAHVADLKRKIEKFIRETA